MKLYNAVRLLYLETDASDIGLGSGLLQVRDDMNSGHDKIPDNAILCPNTFASKTYLVQSSSTATENLKPLESSRKLERFHHYCFRWEVCIITDHKEFAAILSKDVTMLSQHLQCIML